MTVEQRIGEEGDQFPIGMRVLAVDDDPTCLFILEALLHRCQYKVTTTSQAITALRLLRENKDNFDLFISDVHMPDMDGFKLLEYVGLEMDLPVIMLSAHSDPKLVMKGITHGACDYLVKPVRMEELKNIWQHVIRRRSESKVRNGGGKVRHGHDEGMADNKPNKKRKDLKEDEEEDHDEDGSENEDPMTQKKPRVVWSVDLHEAVPKKILELMNVDKRTRENVASHLQKYRLYLKKFSAVANQQALTDVSYLHMGSVTGFGPRHLAGPSHFQNVAFRCLPTGRMLERLNSPSSFGIRGGPSAGVAHLNHVQASSYLTNSQSYFQPNILQGIPISVEMDANMHQGTAQSREVPGRADSRTTYHVSDGSSGEKIIVGTTDIPFLSSSNKPMEGQPQGITLDPKIKIQCPTMASSDSGFSPHYPDCGRWSDSLSVSVQSTGIQLNSFSLSDSFEKAALLPGDLGQSMSTMALQKTNVPCNISSIATLPLQLQDSKADLPCQVDSLCPNAAQVTNYVPQGLDSHMVDSPCRANVVHSSTSSVIPVNQTVSPLVQRLRPSEVIFHKTESLNSVGQSILVDPLSLIHNDMGNSALDTSVRSKDGYMIGQQCPSGTCSSPNSGSLEDFSSVMAKHDCSW